MDIAVRESFFLSAVCDHSKNGRKYVCHNAVYERAFSSWSNDFYNKWNAFKALDSFYCIVDGCGDFSHKQIVDKITKNILKNAKIN